MSNISEHKAVEYYLRKKPDVNEMIIDEVVDIGIFFEEIMINKQNIYL